MNSAITRYCEQFAQLEPQLNHADFSWLRAGRRAALERFAALGFPTVRDEDWKYTNVNAIARHAFNLEPLDNDPDNVQMDEYLQTTEARLVFINGRYAPLLSHCHALPAGCTVTNLAQFLKHSTDAAIRASGQHQDALQALLTEHDCGPNKNAFTMLNAAFWSDGAYIDLPAGVTMPTPIYLLFITTEAELGTMPRNIIRVGKDSRVMIVEHFFGVKNITYFTNTVTRIVAERGAAIEHVKIQQEAERAYHIGGMHTTQQQDSRFTSHSFALGALLSRTDISTRFDAENCNATLNGLYVGRDRQHVDHHTCIDHAKPHGVSREYYKGVMDGAAHAVFNGKVIVRPDAQHCDAHQSNRNLLLSEKAVIDTKPELEIYADDVKCSHGATVGQLNEEQIFFLRSRGIDLAEARSLLIHAFAGDIVDRVGDLPLRQRLTQLLTDAHPQWKTDARLAGATR